MGKDCPDYNNSDVKEPHPHPELLFQKKNSTGENRDFFLAPTAILKSRIPYNLLVFILASTRLVFHAWALGSRPYSEGLTLLLTKLNTSSKFGQPPQ
jgi:hypothetical protein